MRPNGARQHIASGIANPYEETIPRINEYTAKQVATLQSRLDRQLGPEFISTRPGAGGGKVHYLAAEKAINLANEVFGFNGWSSAIQNVQVDFVDESSGGKITIGLSIIVRVTLKDGTHHEDIGYGHIENCKSKAAAFEKAKKEAATDALKRSLRNFGNVLGNCLYDKDYLSRVTKVKVDKQRWDAEDLHRHPSHVIKAEVNNNASNGTRMTSKFDKSNHEPSAVALPEVEDEFGGDLFDEVDFDSHADGVLVGPDTEMTEELDSKPDRRSIGSPIKIEQTNRSEANQQYRSISKVQSTPVLRPGQPLQENSSMQPSNVMLGNDNRTNESKSKANTLNGPQMRQNVQQPRAEPMQSATTNHQPPNPSDPNALRPARMTGPETLSKQDPLAAKALQTWPSDEPVVGFTASRNAEILQKTDGERPQIPPNVTIAPFNPHLDSPSIRRTNHINHSKSAPISRQVVNTPSMPPSAPGVASPAPVSAPAPIPAAALPKTPVAPQNATNDSAASTAARPNFINPHTDPTRKIGMPMGGQSPMPTRSAYKPPGMVANTTIAANAATATTAPPCGAGAGAGATNTNTSSTKRGSEQLPRVPLADVSNAQPEIGNIEGRDMKKTRMMG